MSKVLHELFQKLMVLKGNAFYRASQGSKPNSEPREPKNRKKKRNTAQRRCAWHLGDTLRGLERRCVDKNGGAPRTSHPTNGGCCTLGESA